MPALRSKGLLHDLQTLFESGSSSGQTDRQLLERLASDSARSALEILIHRHGPMVMRVCRNLLANPHDAEDAFQATFLVMVSRGRSIRHLESLSGWLCGVATRVCAKSRAQASRRKQVEESAARRASIMVDPEAEPTMEHQEAARYLQQEVSRLPSDYRDVIVLCFMQGLTHEQAAQRLGRPLGTIRSRVARGKDLLRKRLMRHGLASPTMLLSAFDAGPGAAPGVLSASAPISAELIATTVQAAFQLSAGVRVGTAASAVVASLVHQTVWSMTMIKISSVMAGVALVGFSAVGAGVAAQQGRLASDSNSPSGQPPSAAAAPKDVMKRFITEPSASADSAPQAEIQKKAIANEPSAKVLAQVEGQTIVTKIFEPGRLYKKGEVVLELDSSLLKDQLINQKITTKSAEAIFMNSKLERELAQAGVREFKEVLLPAEVAEIDGDIKLAEAELALAKEERAAIKELNAPGVRLDAKRAELNMLRANIAIEKAQNRRKILLVMTGAKKVRELEVALQKSISNELAREAAWELQKLKERKLERQIAACTISAPRDGFPVTGGGGLLEGSTVRRGQELFWMVSPEELKRMQSGRAGMMGGGMMTNGAGGGVR